MVKFTSFVAVVIAASPALTLARPVYEREFVDVEARTPTTSNDHSIMFPNTPESKKRSSHSVYNGHNSAGPSIDPHNWTPVSPSAGSKAVNIPSSHNVGAPTPPPLLSVGGDIRDTPVNGNTAPIHKYKNAEQIGPRPRDLDAIWSYLMERDVEDLEVRALEREYWY